jgi:site-specific DNA-methyltransferase (adenine-specific)
MLNASIPTNKTSNVDSQHAMSLKPLMIKLSLKDLARLNELVRDRQRKNPGVMSSRASVIRRLIRKSHKSTSPDTTDSWETPDSLFAELDREFHFTLDAAAEPHNAKCCRFFTRADDGLSQPWSGVVWVNPPDGNDTGRWVRKALAESRRQCTVVCLVPARTDTSWFQDIALLHGEVRFLKGRIRFLNPEGIEGNPSFASVLVIFRP